MPFSYSKVSCYNDCPFKYKLNYVDKLKTLPDQSATNALYTGTAAHEGIEKRSIEAALESYKSNYTEITPAHELEMFKLSTILERAIKEVPEGEYEVRVSHEDGFVGFIDCLVKNEDGTYDILDFKCSNNKSGYLSSPQIHIYKYYYELTTGNKVRNIYYVFIPKASTQLTESASSEDLEKAKEKAKAKLDEMSIDIVEVPFNKEQLNHFFARKAIMEKGAATGDFEKRFSTRCSYCEFKKYCQSKGEDTSELTDESKEKLRNTEGLFNELIGK